MPTEAEFTAAANRCRAVADNLGVTEWNYRQLEGRAGLDGVGTARERITRGIIASYLNVFAVREDFETTAAALDTRATESAAYSDAVKAWRRRTEAWNDARADYFKAIDEGNILPQPGPAPVEPPRVPAYVEETNPGSLW